MDMTQTDNNMPGALLKIKDAFAVFESQSGLLASSYKNLEKNLAETNHRLNEKNRALSVKVEELRCMSSRLQCILESLTDGVLVVDSRLVVEGCNGAAERLLKLSRSQMLGRPYADIMNGLGNTSALQSALQENQQILDDQRSMFDDVGNQTFVLASVAPIYSGDGSVLGAVEIMRDVTKIRRLEEEASSRKRMAALGEMAASVAHEFRNPLGSIDGFARLLKRDLKDQPNHFRLASNIVEGVTNLNYVVTNLLAYSRPMTLDYEKFKAGKLFDEVCSALKDISARAGVELVVGREGRDLDVSADIRQMRQVLLNIALNAIQACEASKPVKSCSVPCAEIDCIRRGKQVVFVIADSGCGITKADQQRIFDPFFTRKANGTGLGLSLCHKIVTAHGGTISVTSGPASGSTFEVSLPAGSRCWQDKRSIPRERSTKYETIGA